MVGENKKEEKRKKEKEKKEEKQRSDLCEGRLKRFRLKRNPPLYDGRALCEVLRTYIDLSHTNTILIH